MRQHIISTKQDRRWQGIPGIERASNGRLWCALYTGGPKEPHPDNVILLTTSDDDGYTWSTPTLAVDIPGATRVYDPTLWHDPNGRLWLIYNQANLETKDFSIWVTTTEDSDSPDPVWSAPRKIDIDAPFAFRMNKPTVLRSGAWLLPVTWARTAPDDWFAGDQQLQGVAISEDRGETWTLHGAVEAPHWALENMTVECSDGCIWMLIRAGGGAIWQSWSTDGGVTWAPGAATTMVNPGTRFYIRRLASGRLLLINTPNPTQRTSLFAYLSEAGDDTAFGAGLELDPRDHVSYPDAVQAPDGTIYAVHDCERYGAGEIVLTIFTEEEIPQ